MNDGSDLMLKERFSRQLPPADDRDWSDVLERADIRGRTADLESRPSTAGGRMRRHWRLALGLALPAVILAAAAALFLASPWESGPTVASPRESGSTAISAAEAVTFLKRAQAALAYRPGRVEHIRTRTTYALIPLRKGDPVLYERVSGESWIETAPPFLTRALVSYRSHTLESGGVGRKSCSPYYYFDPATGVFYRDNRFDMAACEGSRPSPDAKTAIRQLLAAGALTSVDRMQIAGRSVYRFELPNHYYDKRLHAYMTLGGTGFLYVDAHDYRIVRFEWESQALQSARYKPSRYGSYRAVIDYLTWEYLPATATNLGLADVQRQHPNARISTLDKMPKDAIRQLVYSIGLCRVPPIPTAGLCGVPSVGP